MSWLKLTPQALYLMKDNSNSIIDKVELEKHGSSGDEYKIEVPLNWFRGSRPPGAMVVSMDDTEAVSTANFEVITVNNNWQAFYGGLELNGSQIPQKGLRNENLAKMLPVPEELFGNVVKFADLDFVRGRTSWFGSSQDDGISETAVTVLTNENLQQLNAQDYYCAMRWSGSPNGKSFWANRPILVINPLNQKAIIVRAVDWGPSLSTQRIINLSPQALKDLAAETDDEVLCAFAKPDGVILGLIHSD